MIYSAPVNTMVKNSPPNEGDARDAGLIYGLGRPLEEKMPNHSSICMGNANDTTERLSLTHSSNDD